jgi:hypothetical protein
MAVPEEYPTRMFDLTVVSEVAVYLEPQDLRTLSERITDQTTAAGHLLLVHCLGERPNYPLRGDDVHEHFLSRPEWRSVARSNEKFYRLDLLERRNWTPKPKSMLLSVVLRSLKVTAFKHLAAAAESG